MVLYFLLANVYALLLYGLYALFLKGNNSQRWSRFYLLGSLALALLLPLVMLDLPFIDSSGTLQNVSALLPEVILYSGSNKPGTVSTDWWLIGYMAIVVLLIARLGKRFLTLRQFLAGLTFTKENGYQIAFNTGIGPASYNKRILFPGHEANPDMLKHEQAHIICKHHYDKLFLSLLSCFCFPVVLLYIIKNELEIIHEFEADQLAASDKEEYAYLLLNSHFNTHRFHLLQSFFHHPIKRRIIMLQQTKNSSAGMRKLLLTATITFAGLAILFQSEGYLHAQKKQPEQSAAKKTKPALQQIKSAASSPEQNSSKTQTHKYPEVVAAKQEATTAGLSEQNYKDVEEMPQFPGGLEGLIKFISENIAYPAKAKKDGIQGKVIAEFIVSKTGELKDIKILNELSPECADEVKRVLSLMPTWTPGKQDGENVNVYFTLPVQFKLGK